MEKANISMEAEQVVEKILAEAKAEAEEIIKSIKDKASVEKAKLDEQLAKYRKETEALAKAAAEDKKMRMLATARMDIGKELLAVKLALLNEVFVKAGEQIKAMGDQEYQELISGLMVKAVETGDEEVIIGRKESRIDDEFIKHINRKLGSGFKGNLRPAKDKADIAGGFILRRGKIQVNVSTEVLFSEVREKLESELCNELFGE